MALTVLLAGGTGLIGTKLQELLRSEGYTVRLLSRRPRGPGQYAWDPEAGRIDERAVENVDVVVNLAGAGIAESRWTAARKRRIVESRVQSARVLREAVQRSGSLPEVYISASATGYYGNSGEKWMTENDPPASGGFMVDTCIAWEAAAAAWSALGIRTFVLRIGIVMAREGGALREFIRPLYFGIGGYFGRGRAWYSWVHREDVCRMVVWAIQNTQAQGIYNAVAPVPVRNLDLIKTAAAAMKRRAVFLPAPPFALRLVFGEMADAILNSNRVSADKIRQAGFRFKYPGLQEALREIFK